MQSMAIKALALGAIAVLAAAPARAGPAAAAAQTWGLIGAWQANCAAAPTVDHPRSVFEIKNGALVYERFSGGQDIDTEPVTGAAVRQDGALVLTIDFTNLGGFREWVLAKTGSNRFRTISNRAIPSGVPSVRDGVLVGTGQPTPWNLRCPVAGGR